MAPYFGAGGQKAVWDKGVRYFTRGLQPGTPGSPRVPRNLPFHFLGEHVCPRGHLGTPGDRRRHGKVKVFSWVRKSMKGWVIFAFNLFKIIWGVNPDKILGIFLIVPRVNYQYQETGISQKFTGVKL